MSTKRINIAVRLPTSIQRAVDQLKRGGLVVLVDSHDRENEADLIGAASQIKPETINFMITNGRGLVCVPMDESNANRLGLERAAVRNPRALQHCNFTQSVDAREGITTGISAADRAYTVNLLANQKSVSGDFATPGHIFPLIGKNGGVLERDGHTEGTIYLLQLAKLTPVGVLCEIIDNDGTMLRGKKLLAYAKKHQLPLCTIEELKAYQRQTTVFVTREVESTLPTQFGEFKVYGYKGVFDKKEHLALVLGKPTTKKPTLLRIHSECLTGDVFGSQRCDCNAQLYSGLEQIHKEGNGILLYLRHEGRGIGLINKLKAYNLQDAGLDTFAANIKLGFKADERDFEVARDILRDLGVGSVRLMSNNPEKIRALQESGITVSERVPMRVDAPAPLLAKYLAAKKMRGHFL